MERNPYWLEERYTENFLGYFLKGGRGWPYGWRDVSLIGRQCCNEMETENFLGYFLEGGRGWPYCLETFPLLEENAVMKWREIRIGWRRDTRKNGVETF